MHEQATIFRFLISQHGIKSIWLSWPEGFKESTCHHLVKQRTCDRDTGWSLHALEFSIAEVTRSLFVGHAQMMSTHATDDEPLQQCLSLPRSSLCPWSASTSP